MSKKISSGLSTKDNASNGVSRVNQSIKSQNVQQIISSLQPPIRIKILSIGSANTGKSCLIKRFCEEKFVSKYIPTIGVDYGVKPISIDGLEVKVNFWDLSGNGEFFEIRNEFYKDIQGCLLVFDVSSRDSFQKCDSWLSEMSKFGANMNEITIVLCANKIDKHREVSEEEGKQYAKARGLLYFETSAQLGTNVQEMFNILFQQALKMITGKS